MLLVRSWPQHPPAGRNRVEDDAVRLLNDNYDYRGLAAFGDDVVHVDWDTAVSREDLVTFAEIARRHPEQVLVAPVPVYADSRKGLRRTVWNLLRYEGADRTRYLQAGEPFCHLFGFGMVYLPHVLLVAAEDAFADQPGVVFSDIAFAGWHHQNVNAEVPVAWDVRPVHLHYRISQVPL
jgi:hypothetical protein